MSNAPIDIVLTWVSGDDLDWVRARTAVLRNAAPELFSEGEIRYRDWGLLSYWFRAVEENAPWVRTIYLITDTRLPSWLNLNHPKLRVIQGSSLTPNGLLTFNSHAIEAQIHLLPDLSEHFVYMNDDFFLTAPVEPEFFFPGGLPYADPSPMFLTDGDVHAHAVLNASGIVNQHFDVDAYREGVAPVLLREPEGFGSAAVPSLAAARRIPPVIDHHLATPLLRSVTEAAFVAGGALLERTRNAPFRSRNDIAPIFLAMHWHVALGRFQAVPAAQLGRYLELGRNSLDCIRSCLWDPQIPQVCVNDGPVADPVAVGEELQRLFSERWPAASTFERVDIVEDRLASSAIG